MNNIIFEFKNNNGIKGLYNGQPFDIDFETNTDKLNMLTTNEVEEVITEFKKESVNPSSMLSVEVGAIVRVSIFEGGEIFEYDLNVTSIEEQGFDDEGNYYCVADGYPIDKESRELAEEFTSRIDSSNFAFVMI